MIFAPCAPLLLAPFAKDAAQPPARISVYGAELIGLAVFEVPKPASQGSAQIRADRTHTSAIGTSALCAYRVFEFIHAFLAWPFHSPLKMIAQKVEPSG